MIGAVAGLQGAGMTGGAGPGTGAAGADGGAALVDAVHRRVVDTMEQISVPSVDIAAIVRALAPLTPTDVVDDVVARVAARVHGLGPVEPLLADPLVSEVMMNGPGPVWVERCGVVSRSQVSLDRAAVDLVIERIVSPLGRRVDQLTPCVDGRLPDGSRVHVAVPPVAVDGPYVTIRRFVVLDVALEMFAGPPMVALLEELVDRGANVVVSGGTGAGKTTLLNALAGRVSPQHRVITIEDAAELQLEHPHVVRLEARPESREGRRGSDDPRPRAQRAADATGPDGGGRGARSGGARPAARPQHGPWRLPVDDARQRARRCAAPVGGAGSGGR